MNPHTKQGLTSLKSASGAYPCYGVGAEFNIIISGVGGQGLITLLGIISRAAVKERYEVRTSELHGLSQRGGSVEVHIRFGRKIWSPLVREGRADIIISLEAQESLRVAHYGSEETSFLINDNFIPIPDHSLLTPQQILQNLKKISKKIFLIPASAVCQKELGNDVVSGIYLLGYAAFKNLIPLKSVSIMTAIEEIVPEKYLEMNKKAFEIGKNYEK